MSITKTGSYLIKRAARWHDFIARLSSESIKKIQNAGLMKPFATYVDGINLGNENIARRLGYKFENNNLYGNKPGSYNLSKVGVNPNTKIIKTDFYPQFQNMDEEALYRAIVNRHELYEALAAEKVLRQYQKYPDKTGRRIIKNFESANPHDIGKYTLDNLHMMSDARKALYGARNTGYLIPDSEPRFPGKAVSGHLDMNVLFKERKLLDRTSFQSNRGLEKIRQDRHATGETQYMDITGEYGNPQLNVSSRERFNKRNALTSLKNKRLPAFVNAQQATMLEPMF